MPEDLTAAERRVLDLLCEGYECDEIAVILDNSPATIRCHMKMIREKRHSSSIFKVVVSELTDGRALGVRV